MADEIPIVTKLRPVGNRVLRIRFAGDRRDYQIDLTGFFARSEHFAPPFSSNEHDLPAAIDQFQEVLHGDKLWERGVHALDVICLDRNVLRLKA